MLLGLKFLGLSFLFGTHLVCMNVAAATPLVAIWLDLREGRRQDQAAGVAGRFLLGVSFLALLAGVLLGLAYAVALYSADVYGFWDGYGRLARRVEWAIYELIFSFALLACARLWWAFAHARPLWPVRMLRGGLLLASSTNLLYHFPPLFAVFAKVATSGNSQGALFEGAQLRAQLFQPDVVSRWAHFILASLAAAGLVLCWHALRQHRRGNAADALWFAALGGRISLLATLAQVPVGLWVLASLPGAAQNRILGAELFATPQGTLGPALMAGSLAGALALLHHLAAISFGQTQPRRLVAAMLLFYAVVVAMSGALLSIRDTLGSQPPVLAATK